MVASSARVEWSRRSIVPGQRPASVRRLLTTDVFDARMVLQAIAPPFLDDAASAGNKGWPI